MLKYTYIVYGLFVDAMWIANKQRSKLLPIHLVIYKMSGDITYSLKKSACRAAEVFC